MHTTAWDSKSPSLKATPDRPTIPIPHRDSSPPPKNLTAPHSPIPTTPWDTSHTSPPQQETSTTTTSTTNSATLSSPYINQACSYNNRGNLTSTLLDHTSKNFVHNQQDRVIKEPDHTYQYDQLHNRTSHNNIPVTYNTLNENTAYTYDPNGNLLSDGDNTYTYDSLDRLIGLNNQTYTYDAQHRRTDLLWDHDREIGTLDELRILDPNHPSDYAIAIISNHLLLPVHDIHHNLLKVFTLDGTLIESRTLTSFGESSPSSIPWSFCGKRITQQLLYFGARYYSPSDERFLTPDPAGYTDSLNLYAYALNNPLRYFDPNGLSLADFSNTWLPDFCCAPPDPKNQPPYINYDEKCHRDRPSHVEALKFWKPAAPKLSKEYDLGLPEPSVGRIYFMNGINTNLEEALGHAKLISDMSGGYNVHLLYNATHGIFKDGVQALLGMRFRLTNIEKLVINSVSSYLNDNSDKRALIMSHSHGAIGVRNALHFYTKQEHRERIYSLATAPGAYINPKDCSQSIALKNPNDLTPTFDKFGAGAYAETIINVAPRVPNSFRMHHSFPDPVYKTYHRSYLDEYLQYGRLSE